MAGSSAPRSRSTKAPLLYPKEPESSAVRTPLKMARDNALEMTTFFFNRANNSQTKIAPIQIKNLNLSAFTTTTRPISAGGASARITVLDSGKMHQSAHHPPHSGALQQCAAPTQPVTWVYVVVCIIHGVPPRQWLEQRRRGTERPPTGPFVTPPCAASLRAARARQKRRNLRNISKSCRINLNV